MRSNNELVFLGSASVSSNSQCMLSEQWIRASFQVDCLSGALNGSFVVQVSNDKATGVPPEQFTPTFWNTIGSTQQVAASISANSSVLIPFFETCYKYHRIVFTAGNGGNTVGSISIRAETRAL